MAKRRRYSPEEIERGLTALILAGSSPKASQLTNVPEDTLRAWKRDHADQYDRLCKDLEPRIVDKIAAEAESMVLELSDINRGYAQRLRDTMHELKPGEIPGAMRNVATASALYVDKHSSPLRERPSHVQHQPDLESLIKQMGRTLGFDATTTAIDVTNETPAPTLVTQSTESNVRVGPASP